jgi:L1 cell adhesion molecule like protein
MPRGVPQIEVTYDVDANGILNVSAAEKSTGKSEKITITNDKGRLNKDDIERMVAEAAAAAEEDKVRMERVEAKNGLESYLYNARNSFRDEKAKEKTDAATLEKAEGILKGHIEWLEANPDESTETYKERQKSVEEEIRPMLMAMYGATDSSGQGAQAAAAQPEPTAEPSPRVEEID